MIYDKYKVSFKSYPKSLRSLILCPIGLWAGPPGLHRDAVRDAGGEAGHDGGHAQLQHPQERQEPGAAHHGPRE